MKNTAWATRSQKNCTRIQGIKRKTNNEKRKVNLLLIFSFLFFVTGRVDAQNNFQNAAYKNQLAVADGLIAHDSIIESLGIVENIYKETEAKKDKYAQAESLMRLGFIARAQNNHAKAAQNFDDAGTRFRELKLSPLFCKALAERGISELKSQKRSLASELFYSALKVYDEDLSPIEKTQNIDTEALIFERLATLLGRQSFSKAENYALQAINLHQKLKDDYQLNVDYTTLGTIYFRNRDLDRALIHYQKSYDLCKKNNYNTGRALVNIGIVYDEKRKHTEAIDLYNNAVKEYEKKSGNEILIAQAYINMGSSYDSLKNYKSGIDYSLKSINLLHQAQSTNGLREAYYNLITAYKNTGQTEKALECALLSSELQQTEFREAQKLSDNQSVYENKKIEKEAGDKLRAQQDQLSSIKKQQELQLSNQNLLAEKNFRDIDILNQSRTLQDLELKRTEDMLTLAKNKLDYNQTQLALAETDKRLNEQKVKTQSAYNLLLSGLLAAGLILGLTFWQIIRSQMRHEREKATAEQLRLEASILRTQLESEIKLLRAQMNPHFIFNALNSINNFLLHNNTESASHYLTRFSKLVRLVLDNARSEKITLHNELYTLELYMQFEALRFADKIKYQIIIAPTINTEDIRIPPLLLQPYVENAIWHGIMHKIEGGLIKINISDLQEDKICIEIEDNGIGRQAASTIKSKSATKNKSHGMQITAERLQLLDEMYKTKTHININDLFDHAGNACGTKVRMEIPV